MKRSILPAGLLAAVVAFGFIGRAEAVPIPATLSFGYTGSVSGVTDPSSVTGLHLGDTISGSLIFDPLNNVFTTTTDTIGPPPGFPIGSTNHFAEDGRFSFGAVPGTPHAVNSASGTVDSNQSSFIISSSGLHFALASGGDSITLDFSGFLSSTPPLTSLTQLPADSTGIAQLFASFFTTGTGHINYIDSQIDFVLDVGTYTPTAATPVPATVWLFASALGGLGALGWKRRQTLAAAA
jgi:hypothetical protein